MVASPISLISSTVFLKERRSSKIWNTARQSKEVFYDKLGYKLLVSPNFRKKHADIKSYMDMWLYLFRHITELEEMPEFLDNRVFGLMFDTGKAANLTQSDMKIYESSLKNKRDAES